MSKLTDNEKAYVDNLSKIAVDKIYPKPTQMYSLLFYIAWIAGIVISKGFWSCLFSITFPPWSLYLFIERVLIAVGLV